MVKTLDSHFVTDINTCGGQPRIAGRRIMVGHIAVWHEEQGKSVAQIANDYDLSFSDIYAALAYYYDNKEDIVKLINQEENYAEKMKNMTVSKLSNKLNGKQN
ncbi:DUF433 domain-containing protein [Emticicia sp. SJ17W-69]|uniref:DUF433 domain-containing protein n=1 Tax=Emticicia sp. SJ17W-69 TaxID=3421657 RepID=UPI003EB8EE96